MPRRHRQALERSTADSAVIGVGHTAPREALNERAGAAESGALQVTIPTQRLIHALYAIVGVFVVIQAILLVWRFGFDGEGLVVVSALFTLDAEDNLPTVFSCSLLIGSALLCAFAGGLETPRVRSLRPYWFLLGCVFAFLAADEAIQLHEMVGRWVRAIWKNRGFMQWPWVIPYLMFAAGLAAFCVPFLRRLPRATARQCVVAGTVYVIGAGGMDMIEGAVSHAMRNGARHLEPLFRTLPIVEEPMEMIGIILFIAAILRYLADQGDVIRVRVIR